MYKANNNNNKNKSTKIILSNNAMNNKKRVMDYKAMVPLLKQNKLIVDNINMQ